MKQLPEPPKKNKVAKTLYFFLHKRTRITPELGRLTNVGYPPRKIQLLEEKGIRFQHSLTPYTTTEGVKTNVAKYRLITPMREARKIYLQMVKSAA